LHPILSVFPTDSFLEGPLVGGEGKLLVLAGLPPNVSVAYSPQVRKK